jgi:hypothetical protein
MTQRPPSSRGALTGATGDLTPDEVQRDFEPGEWREASGADHQADVTRSQASHAHAHAHRKRPAELAPDEGPTELAGRESGYGTDAGLAPDDPAYRMEVRPESPRIKEPEGAGAEPHGRRETRIGGDELADHEEHL